MSKTEGIFLLIALCLAAASILGALLRRGGPSLGLPFAYFGLVLLEHLPGAWAVAAAGDNNAVTGFVQTGLYLTTIGLLAFVVGVWISRRHFAFRGGRGGIPIPKSLRPELVPHQFILFCLLGGWLLTFGIRIVIDAPSINAVVEKGGAIWQLAVIIGLASSVKRRSVAGIAVWIGALLVYPASVLLIGGFMSWGTISIFIVASVFCVLLRSYWLFLMGAALAGILGVSLFISYFEIRSDLRVAAWSGAPISERASQAAKMFADFDLVSSENPQDLTALSKRLNQNYFIGVAAARLERGDVEFLSGRSFWEAAAALVPRAIWPSKPMGGGSGSIVNDMTGLNLESKNTAWGVGSVMEFYVNFGIAGLIFGFFSFGFVIARLDQSAAFNLMAGSYGNSVLFFLPAVALIQPLGSLVELSGGAAAAFLSGYAWREAWMHLSWSRRKYSQSRPAGSAGRLSEPVARRTDSGLRALPRANAKRPFD